MSSEQESDRSQSTGDEDVEGELQSLRRELERREKAQNDALEIAQRVQVSMLPGPVRHQNIDIDIRYIPLEKVGGDYCQVLFPVDSCCYISVCDVAGHGIGPALMATRVSSEVRRLVLEQLPPSEVVRNLNQFVIDHFAEAELFLSFFVAQLDFQNGTVNYSGAGHPGPLLIRHNSLQTEVLHSQNLLIGVREKCLSDRPSDQLDVGPGDRLIFYTDGLTETRNVDGRMLNVEGVEQMATITCDGGLFGMADCFLERLDAFRHGLPQDDLTLIIAELK